jgi:hypothetical protein
MGEDGSYSPEGHTFPNSLSSTVYDRMGTAVSPDERICQSPAIAMGSLAVDHESVRRDNSPRIASTHRGEDPGGVGGAGHQSHAGIFNSARSATINGGTFLFVQGNMSYGRRNACTPNEVTAGVDEHM